MEVLQIPGELEHLLAIYRKRRPRRVLEIGCWDGGTLREWLQQGTPRVVVAVDLEHRNAEAYEEWRKPETKLHTFTGESQSAVAIAAIERHGPYNWLFVDGDHDESAVRIDIATCLANAAAKAMLVLHDITAGAGYPETGPRVMLEELRAAGYPVQEFTDEPGSWPWAHGIGIVQLP